MAAESLRKHEHADCVPYYYIGSPENCKWESLKSRKKSKRGRHAALCHFIFATRAYSLRRMSHTGTITASGSTQLTSRSAFATGPGEQTHRLSLLARSAWRTMYFAWPAK